MKATHCIFHAACRFQQALAANSSAEPNRLPYWAVRVGCNDEKDDMDMRCRLFERAREEVINQLRSCPICLGKGKLHIADYVAQSVVPDAEINCPACEGLGIIRFPESAASCKPMVTDSRDNSAEAAL